MSLTPADIESAISEIDFDESFYFELKDDRVSPKKMMEEVSAFSNTFGGYIFLANRIDFKKLANDFICNLTQLSFLQNVFQITLYKVLIFIPVSYTHLLPPSSSSMNSVISLSLKSHR